jgi:Predicted transporter component
MLFMVISGLATGIAFGFVCQRGRFCVTSAFRDLYLAKDNRMFIAFLIAITVQSVGLFTLSALNIAKIPTEPFPWLGVIAGGFIFGLGMVYSGGCAAGTYYRAAEGLIGSITALITFMISAAIMKFGPLSQFTTDVLSVGYTKTTIYQTLGLSPWIFVGILVLITGYLVWTRLKKEKKFYIPESTPQRKGLAHLLFEKRWHPFITGILIGIVALVAWPLSLITGRVGGLGITTPSANLIVFLTTGNAGVLNWPVFLILGILVGAFFAARLSGEFKFRTPDTKTMVHSLEGGVLMGVGASLAGGCSIGNGLVASAYLSWQGWIAIPSMILGTWVAAYFIIVRPMRQQQNAAAGQTQTSTAQAN